MRFGKHPSRPPYLNTRDQLRLLVLVALLGLVLAAMKLAADPKMWSWMFPEEPTQEVGNSERQSETEPEQAVSGRAGFFPVEPERLGSVEDDVLGVRSDEAAVFYDILARLSETPSSRLQEAADPTATYSALMAESDHYRGRLIQIAGRLRRLRPLQAAENPVRINRLYEAWITTNDSGSQLLRIVCTAVPKDLPRGETIDDPVPVSVVGCFFKREGYASRGGLAVAPLILAKRLERVRPAATAARPAPPTHLAPYLVGFVAAVAVGLGITVWRFSVGDRKFYNERIKRITQAPPEAVRELQNLETTDPADELRRLARRDSETSRRAEPDR